MDKRYIDINCDMGESSLLRPNYEMEKDIALMEYISSINLACGFHAGDPTTMHTLTEAALERGIAIGAHPSFPDKENFGRKAMPWKPEWLYDQVIYQLGALEGFLKIRGAKLNHVKPHGALYNLAAKDLVLADIIAKAISDFDSSLIFYGLSGSCMAEASKKIGITFSNEVFADRTYRADGSLTDRSNSNAMIETAEKSLEQVLNFCQNQEVKTIDGTTLSIKADTICIHSDGANAKELAAVIYHGLRKTGTYIRSNAIKSN